MLPISIIIPVYNARFYLENTINSVLAQTFNNFELIIINDGSTDGSAELCEEIAKKDKRITVLHQQNQGVCATRNKGIEVAQSEYICFIDADDEVEPDMLECLYNNAKEYNVDISCCGILQKTLNGKINSQFCSGEKEYHKDNKKLISGFFDNPVYREVLYGPYNKLIKSDIVKSVHFNKNFAIGEDLLFLFECIEKTKSFYFENRGLYHYIKRPNSATTSSFSVKRFDYIYVADILLEKCKSNYSFAYNAALKWVYIHKLNMCRSLCKHTAIKNQNKEFYNSCYDFCIKNKAAVFNRLPIKKKIDYMVLRVFPTLYKII